MLSGPLRFIRPSREYREMALLYEIGKGAPISQRGLARIAQVSATMVNAYVDDLVSRGLLDVSGDTNRTYSYRLTPAGAQRSDELFFQVSREVVEVHARVKAEFERRLAASEGRPISITDEELWRRLRAG
jgi:DNA-binding MarR family transcriptional regulator